MLDFKPTESQISISRVFSMTTETVPVLLLFSIFSVFSPAEQSLRTFHVIKDRMNYSAAQTACRTNYTDLVTVYTDEDNTALTNLTGYTFGFIGLYRNQSSYKWSNGDDVTFSNLTVTCSSGPTCAAMQTDGLWVTLSCTQMMYFMCYEQAGTELSYHLISESLTWYDAQSYCRSNYADLVSIRDQNQNEAVKINGMNSNTPFWIGLLCDDWEWSDGGHSAYRHWGMSQPQSSSLNCVVMIGGSWYSVSCSNNNPALCYSTSVHVSDESMSWEDALNYCKQGNRTGILRIDSDQDQRELKYELTRRGLSGSLWTGLGQNRLAELLTSSSGLSLGPWTSWPGQTQPPLSLSRGSLNTVKKTCQQKMLRAVCQVH